MIFLLTLLPPTFPFIHLHRPSRYDRDLGRQMLRVGIKSHQQGRKEQTPPEEPDLTVLFLKELRAG